MIDRPLFARAFIGFLSMRAAAEGRELWPRQIPHLPSTAGLGEQVKASRQAQADERLQLWARLKKMLRG